MTYLEPMPVYLLGILTYHLLLKFRSEIRGTRRGGEIERILKIK